MILIIGGAGQGKLNYAKQKFHLTDADFLDGEFCDVQEMLSAKHIKNYQLFLKRIENPVEFTEQLCQKNPKIIIMNEIGSGIIPMERAERIWREDVGKCGCILANASELVIRMICGIPEVIKGDK